MIVRKPFAFFDPTRLIVITGIAVAFLQWDQSFTPKVLGWCILVFLFGVAEWLFERREIHVTEDEIILSARIGHRAVRFSDVRWAEIQGERFWFILKDGRDFFLSRSGIEREDWVGLLNVVRQRTVHTLREIKDVEGKGLSYQA